MRTRFAALSKSAIFCGNQGAFANASAYKKIILHIHVGRSCVRYAVLLLVCKIKKE